MAKKKSSSADSVDDDASVDNDANVSPENSFNLVIGRVITRRNKKQNIDEGESLISIGPLPIIYSKLVAPTHPNPKEKYTVMFSLTKEQRNKVVAELAAVGVEIAAIRGLTLTVKEVESILRAKMSELEEPDTYKLAADQRTSFEKEDGPSVVHLTVKGPDGEDLVRPFLTNGSEGYANFVMACTINRETKKPQFPFRLKAVKVTKPVFYEKKDGERIAYDDFSQVESPY